MKKNLLICSGGACPLRLTCRRFHAWLDNEDEDTPEMEPDHKKDHCDKYIIIEFYGQ